MMLEVSPHMPTRIMSKKKWKHLLWLRPYFVQAYITVPWKKTKRYLKGRTKVYVNITLNSCI
jgi:hypothetical protein